MIRIRIVGFALLAALGCALESAGATDAQPQSAAVDDALPQLRTRYGWGGLYLTPYDLTVLYNATQRTQTPSQQEALKLSSPGAVRVRKLLAEFGPDFRSKVSCVFLDLTNVRAGYLTSRGSMGVLVPISWTSQEVAEAAVWVSLFLRERQSVEQKLDEATALPEIVDIWNAQTQLSSSALYTEEDRAAVAAVLGANLTVDERQADKLRRSNPKLHREIIGFQLAYGRTVDMAHVAWLVEPAESQKYIVRSQVAAGLQVAAPARLTLTEFFAEHGRWPTSAQEAGIRELTGASAKYVEDLSVGPFGAVTVTYKPNVAGLGGKSITFTPVVKDATVKWTCVGGSVPSEVRPGACR